MIGNEDSNTVVGMNNVKLMMLTKDDEGNQRLPKCLKLVTLLASVYEPQSCQNYLTTQDCLKICVRLFKRVFT